MAVLCGICHWKCWITIKPVLQGMPQCTTTERSFKWRRFQWPTATQMEAFAFLGSDSPNNFSRRDIYQWKRGGARTGYEQYVWPSIAVHGSQTHAIQHPSDFNTRTSVSSGPPDFGTSFWSGRLTSLTKPNVFFLYFRKCTVYANKEREKYFLPIMNGNLEGVVQRRAKQPPCMCQTKRALYQTPGEHKYKRVL